MNQSPKYIKRIVSDGIFSSSPLVVVDVGARSGFEGHWVYYGKDVKLIGFEVDAKECEKLNHQSADNEHFYPVALDSKKGRRAFYVTALPDASGFYPPDMEFCNRLLAGSNVIVKDSVTLNTVDFDSLVAEEHITSVDFIKLDTEGSELDILIGSINTLCKSVLGLSIEVEFNPVRVEQPLFSDIDLFLRPLGFRLFALSTHHLGRKTILCPSSLEVKGASEYGQVLWGQALYLRDGVVEIEHAWMIEDGWDDIKIHKLASLMELFNLPDCAIELLQVSKAHGYLAGTSIAQYVDLLMPATLKSDSVLAGVKRVSMRILPKALLVAGRNILVRLRNLIDRVINI